ncbi:hypothetical protein GCM10028864_22690 [Microlunatus parietis]
MADDAVQKLITSFWNQVAPGYDEPANVAAPGTAAYADWREAIGSVLPGSPAEVLDVGTGTGFVARIAAELGHRVTGIDLSEGMLARARAATGAEASVAYRVGDAVAPPFPATSFDAVISRSVLWTLRKPGQAFRNWFTLLRQAGQVAVIYGLADRPPPQSAAPEQRAGLFQRTYTDETRAALTAMYLDDHGPLIELAEAAGFADVTVRPLTRLTGWENSPGSALPYALVGYRPVEPGTARG